jgi:hypothetical protein
MVRSVAAFLLVFALGAAAGGALVYGARGGGRHGAGAEMPMAHRLAVLQERLGLRAEQRARIEALMAGYHRRFAARAHALVGADPELSAARDAMHAELRAILDDDQRLRFDELVRAHGPMGPGPFGGGPPWMRGGAPP